MLKKIFKDRKIKKHLTRKNIVVAIIAGLFLIQYIQIQSILGTFSFLQGRDSSLIKEIGMIRESYADIGEDLNEVRQFLRLPVNSYASIEEQSSEDIEANAVSLAMFKYIGALDDAEESEEKMALRMSFLELLEADENLSGGKAAHGVGTVGESDESYSVKLVDQSTVILDKNDASLVMQTSLGEDVITAESESEFRQFMIDHWANEEARTAQLSALNGKIFEVSSALETANKQDFVIKHEIKFPEPKWRESLISWNIVNRSDELIGEILLDRDDLSVTFVDTRNPELSVEPTDLATAITPFLNKLDYKTPIEKKQDQARQDLEEVFQDKGFQLFLKETGFSIETSPRGEKDTPREFYDIFNESGVMVGSIVLEPATGVISIVEPDGTNAQNLLQFDPEVKKKL